MRSPLIGSLNGSDSLSVRPIYFGQNHDEIYARAMPKLSVRRALAEPGKFRILASLYPPLLGSGIRIAHVSDDWTHGTVRMRVLRWTANAHGAAFGGALFSATDALYGMLLMGQLGKDYEVWTKSARIDFLLPGKGTLTSSVRVEEAEVAEIRDRLAADPTRRITVDHAVTLVNEAGEDVAVAYHTMSVQLRNRPALTTAPTTS